MKRTVILTALLSCLLCCCTKENTNVSGDIEYDLYVLLGQSNMVGYAPMEKNDTAVIKGVCMLDREGNIIPASAPLNRFSTIRFMGKTFYGPGSSFAKKMRFETGRYILLVSNARGGSAIAEWQKDNGMNFYDEAIRRTKQAMSYPGVKLKGILWHQGESDCTRSNFEEYYYRLFTRMVEDFRADLESPDLPIVVGETYYGASYASLMNPVIAKVADYVPHSACVSAEGCGTLGDNIHFNHEGYDILGARYAEKMLELCGER